MNVDFTSEVGRGRAVCLSLSRLDSIKVELYKRWWVTWVLTKYFFLVGDMGFDDVYFPLVTNINAFEEEFEVLPEILE